MTRLFLEQRLINLKRFEELIMNNKTSVWSLRWWPRALCPIVTKNFWLGSEIWCRQFIELFCLRHRRKRQN